MKNRVNTDVSNVLTLGLRTIYSVVSMESQADSIAHTNIKIATPPLRIQALNSGVPITHLIVLKPTADLLVDFWD